MLILYFNPWLTLKILWGALRNNKINTAAGYRNIDVMTRVIFEVIIVENGIWAATDEIIIEFISVYFLVFSITNNIIGTLLTLSIMIV